MARRCSRSLPALLAEIMPYSARRAPVALAHAVWARVGTPALQSSRFPTPLSLSSPPPENADEVLNVIRSVLVWALSMIRATSRRG